MESKTSISNIKPNKKKIIIQNITEGNSVSVACKNADISRFTYYKWAQDDEKFRERLKAAFGSRVSVVEDSLYGNAVKGNVTAQIFWLCNRNAEDWKSINNNNQGSGNTVIMFNAYKSGEIARPKRIIETRVIQEGTNGEQISINGGESKGKDDGDRERSGGDEQGGKGSIIETK